MKDLLQQRLTEAHAFAKSLVPKEPVIRPNLRGACAVASAWLMTRLQKDGLHAEVVICYAHCYVRAEGMVLDPTATQFGMEPFVAPEVPDHDQYEPMEYSDNLDELMNLMDNSGWSWDAERIYKYVVKGEAA